MNPPEDRSKVVTPRQARRQFLASKRGSVKDSTVRAYKFPTRHFVEFCEKREVESVSQIDGYIIETWKQSRRTEDIKRVTLHNNVKHVRVFVRWCERTDLVEHGTADRIKIPELYDGEDVSDDVLRLGQAEDVLRYLRTYSYGGRNHALFQTLWHTGCRIGGALALDLDDYVPDHDGGSLLKFRNRPERGTPLKNRNKGERNVTINDELKTVLNDYLAAKRKDSTDDFDREPLFTTRYGRLSRQGAYKTLVALTRPCHIVGVCPHDREIDECDAAQLSENAPACPSSVSLHPIRRGSITYHVDRGFPKEKLSERVDVSVKVLDKHYDARTKEQEREGRREYLDIL